MTEESKNSGWWGSTLGKLRSALAKTKEAVVDSVLEPAEDAAATPAEPALHSHEIGNEHAGSLHQNYPDQNYQNQILDQHLAAPTYQPEIQPEVPSFAWETGMQLDANPPSQLSTAAASQTAAATMEPNKLAERPALPIDEDYLEELEEKLIRADLGLTTVETLVNDLRKLTKTKGATSRDLEGFLKREFSLMLAATSEAKLNIDSGLSIILVVGVNGTGKTTSIGKLAYRLRQQGKRVLLAAGDTFRAAAETQLEIWAERAQVDIVRLPDGSDPGAVVFQSIKKARAENYDVLIIDTAGRLHNKVNLMAELKKVRGVIDKNAGDLKLECLLVLDASTGQNGLQQAKVFTEACGLSGVILTKLDGTAKGGVIFAVANELKIPVKLIGLGEKMEDLRDFEPELFIEALF